MECDGENSVKAHRVNTRGMPVTGSSRSRMVFEASQLTHATSEVPVFCGLLRVGGQSAMMQDRNLGQSFPKTEKLYTRHDVAPTARVVREPRIPGGFRRRRSHHRGALAYHIRR